MIGALDLAAAALLIAAGAGKVGAPAPATAMLRRALPAPLRRLAAATAVRLAGLAEVAVGVAVVLTGARAALLLLAAAYAAFAAVAVRLVKARQRTSCGCFGRADAPVGPEHLVLNAAGVAVAVAGAVRPPGRWGGAFAGDVLPGLLTLAQSALLAYLAFLSITALPALGDARRRVRA
jgi:hypothetical protein